MADGRPEEGLSEVPTDPSAPSHPREESISALREQHVSHASSSHPSKRIKVNSSGVSGARNATAIDRGPPRRKEAQIKTEMEVPNTPEPAPPPDASKDEHVGKVFGGKYRVDKLVAKGGMGRVYRAMQFPLERAVAIKILNREFQRTDPQFVRRFFLEAATAAKLSHPHTITVFDYGEADTGELYIAMEYLRGRPLSRVITNDGPFPADRALRISIQVCRAVREAHQLGIIHRDLKPGNIFLVDEGDEGDYAKVLDFGLVKLFRPEHEGGKKDEPGMLGEGDPELTRTGTLLGSPKYMSPEQIQGHHLDPRTDIYSFGVILFQMLAAKPPYSGATGVDVIYKHVHAPIPAIAEINAEVECPEAVEALVRKCLSKKREDRYSSMDELIVALKETLRLLNGVAVSADSLAEIENSRSDSLRGKARPESLRPRPEQTFKEQDVDAPTPVGQLSGERSPLELSGPAPVRPSRTPMIVAAIGFAIALVTLAYVTMIAPKLNPPEPDKIAANPPPAAAVAPTAKSFELRFTSEPAGARVFEGATALGVTPFAKTFEISDPRELVFRYPGYKDQVKSVALDGSVTALEVTLEAETAALEEEDEDTPQRTPSGSKKRRPQPAQKAKKDDGPYRKNPY